MKKIGIVGCGNISATHAWALKNIDHVQIVAVADINIEKAMQLSKKYTNGAALAFDNYEEMLEKERIDVVHICTPHSMHVPMALKALNKGIAVFCEKPPAISMREFEALENFFLNKKANIGFCFQNRYNKAIIKMDEIVMEGKLGKVTGARAFVTWRRDEEYYCCPWKGKAKYAGGGALMNQSIHTLDLLLRYFGEPVKVESSVSNHHLDGIIEVEDTVEAWMEFSGGERVCFYASTGYVVDAPIILEFECERGSVTIIDKIMTIRDERGNTNSIVCEEPKGIGKSYWGSGHLRCIQDFYEKLDTGEVYQNNLNGVSKTMKTTMRIYEMK